MRTRRSAAEVRPTTPRFFARAAAASLPVNVEELEASMTRVANG